MYVCLLTGIILAVWKI